MVPLIELRGAIPIAVGMGLPTIPSLIIAVLGNMVPVPFIFLFARRLLEWGKNKKIISTREILNFIYEIIVPADFNIYSDMVKYD